MAIGLPLISRLDPRAIATPISLCILGGVSWSAASLALLPTPQNGLLDLLFLVLLCGAALAAAELDDIGPTLAAFGWGIALSAALTVPQAFGWSPVYQTVAPAGLFLNSEVLAEVAAPLLVWSLWTRRWPLAAVIGVPISLCHSRIAVLVVAVGLLYGWRPTRRWMKPALVVAVAAAAVAGIACLGIAKESSALTRVTLWLAAVQSITPLGRGLSWWALAHPGPYEEFAHSDALQMIVELGAGSLFFLAIPFMVLRRRDVGSTGERAAFVSLCVEAVVSFPLHLPAQGFLLSVLAGFLARARPHLHGPGLASRDDLSRSF